MADVIFPTKPQDLDSLIEHLNRVREAHGNMPLGSYAAGQGGVLGGVCVYTSRIGLSKGPKKLVSRGGRECLVIEAE